MKLRARKDTPAAEDQKELQERTAVGATPGQKLVGAIASVGAVVVIGGGLAYNFWYLPSQAKQAMPADKQAKQEQNAPPSSPSLDISLGLGGTQAQADPMAPNPLPPGMVGTVAGLGGAPTGHAPDHQVDEASAELEAQRRARLEQEREQILKRKLASSMGGVQAVATTGRPVQAQEGPSMATPAGGPFPAGSTPLSGGAPGPNDFSGRLVPTATPGVTASLIPNPSFTVKKGTPIRCTLDTAMNSDAPGFVQCTVSKPVYGMDGRVVLIDRGSTVDGELAKGPDRGKRRAQVLWGRIVTPYNVHIEANSPGTDTLGAAGLEGSIDNHYCERFCGAFLFSTFQDIVQGGMQALTNSASGNTTIVLPQNTMSTGQNAAGEILMQGRNVMPTFTKNQGDEITITVARDLDFSSVYRLEAIQR